MECRENPGERNNLKSIKLKACRQYVVYLRWAPPKEKPTKSYLFRVVGYVWPKTIDRATKVSVRTLDDVRVCHEWF